MHLAAWIPQNRDALTYCAWQASEDGGAIYEWQVDVFASTDGTCCAPSCHVVQVCLPRLQLTCHGVGRGGRNHEGMEDVVDGTASARGASCHVADVSLDHCTSPHSLLALTHSPAPQLVAFMCQPSSVMGGINCCLPPYAPSSCEGGGTYDNRTTHCVASSGTEHVRRRGWRAAVLPPTFVSRNRRNRTSPLCEPPTHHPPAPPRAAKTAFLRTDIMERRPNAISAALTLRCMTSLRWVPSNAQLLTATHSYAQLRTRAPSRSQASLLTRSLRVT